jgi:hypothetical protein
VKPESKFYQKFKKKTPLILWTRLESWASFGVPDLLGYNDARKGGLKDIKLYGSKSIQALIHDPRAVNPLAVNDFEKIQKILINNYPRPATRDPLVNVT